MNRRYATRNKLLIVASFAILFLTAHLDANANARSREDIASPHACQAGEDTFDSLDIAAQRDPVAPPRRPNQPVNVELGFYVEQLSEISEADHSFRIEAFVDMIWCDPRLAYSAEEKGEARKVYLEELAHETLRSIWWPDLAIVNAAEPPRLRQEELLVYPDGTVVYEERLVAEIKARLDLSKFPFDTQQLEIEAESFAWPSSDLVLHLEEDKIGFSEQFNIPSWRLIDYEAGIIVVQEIRDRDTFSEFVMVIEAERVWAPYFFRLMIPLILIVIASWSVFWLRPSDTGRFGVTFTAILTVVAFNFIVTGRLPNVPELTYLEALFGVSFAFLLLVVIENTIVDRMEANGRPDDGWRIDQLSQRLFPLIYFIGVGVVTLIFGIV